MLWKELVQLRRDRFTLALMLGIPAIQLALFGYAIQTEVRHLPTVVLDESRSSESRRLVEIMRNTGNFDIIEHGPTPRPSSPVRIETGRANAGAGHSAGLSCDDLKRGRAGGGAGDRGCGRPAGLLGGAVGRGPCRLGPGGRRWRGADAAPPPLEIRVRPWYNPGLQSSVYIVPGIIGVLLSLTLVLITEHGDRAGARARHAGAVHRDSDRQDQPHAGEDPSLPADRVRADHRHPAPRPAACSTCRSSAVCRCSICSALPSSSPAWRWASSCPRWCGRRCRRCS